MKYLIDGYNLLHASPLIQTGSGVKWLEKQRFRLLSELAKRLPLSDRAETVVVFDARESPAGVPSEYAYEGIFVRFARDHAEADDLIEELIERHASTSSLTVVSSDLRLQRAARRRRAAFSDSRLWFDSLLSSQDLRTQESDAPDPEQTKNQTLDAGEVDHWLSEMGLSESADKNSRRSPASNIPLSRQAKRKPPMID